MKRFSFLIVCCLLLCAFPKPFHAAVDLPFFEGLMYLISASLENPGDPGYTPPFFTEQRKQQNAPTGLQAVQLGLAALPQSVGRLLPMDLESDGVVVHPVNDASRRIASLSGSAPLPLMYFTSDEGDNLRVFDPSVNRVLATVGLNGDPRGLAISPDGKFIYVSIEDKSAVRVFDTELRQVVATIPLPGATPWGMAITPDGRRLYVPSASAAGAVYVVDTESRSHIETIRTGRFLIEAAVSPDGSVVYVSSNGDGRVFVIDVMTNTVIQALAVDRAYGIAFSARGDRVFVTSASSVGRVTMFDTRDGALSAEWPVGDSPLHVKPSPDGRRVFVTNRGSDFLSVIDPGKNTVEMISVGAGLGPMAILPQPAQAGAMLMSDIEMLPAEMSGRVQVPRSPRGVLSAFPNPCLSPSPDQLCSTGITWDTRDVMAAEVSIEEVGSTSGERLFAAGRRHLSVEAPWITAGGQKYAFRLYDVSHGGRTLLDSVEVGGRLRPAGQIHASPDTCTLYGWNDICIARLSWRTQNTTDVEVAVRDVSGGESETIFSVGTSSDDAVAPWIQAPPHRYVFTLYDVSGGERVRLDSVEVGGSVRKRPEVFSHPPL